ncbi:hypothetical protein ACFRAO_37740 [Streptomyces sp. NPDC056656]|uniref:hypothetical protein n=1 Tax=Streptomyces sp. NPDC056656 TaxID=3345895 RepID=UPI003698B4DB
MPRHEAETGLLPFCSRVLHDQDTRRTRLQGAAGVRDVAGVRHVVARAEFDRVVVGAAATMGLLRLAGAS